MSQLGLAGLELVFEFFVIQLSFFGESCLMVELLDLVGQLLLERLNLLGTNLCLEGFLIRNVFHFVALAS